MKKILDEEQSIAQAVRARRRQHYSTLTHVLSHSLKENHPPRQPPIHPAASLQSRGALDFSPVNRVEGVMEKGESLYEAENVVAGKTAFGKPSSLGPIPIPTGHVNVCHAAALARRVMTVLADGGDYEFLPDDVRTAIHFKILAFVSKQGRNLDYAYAHRSACSIGDFLVEHPRAVSSKAGFLRLAQMAAQRAREQANQSIEDRIEHFRTRSGAPSRPTVWTGGVDGSYRIEELTHPFHIWEEGNILGNCLGDLKPGSRGTVSPDDLPYLHYWMAHKRGLALYAVRKNDRHLGVIAIDGDRVKEMHLSVSMGQYPRVWREMRDFLVRRHGPLRDASIRHNGIVARFIRNC